MSKYNLLWEHVSSSKKPSITLSFEEVESIIGMPIDHSFLTFKKELFQYGYKVDKISMKQKSVSFAKIND